MYSDKLPEYLHKAFMKAFKKFENLNFVFEWPEGTPVKVSVPNNVKIVRHSFQNNILGKFWLQVISKFMSNARNMNVWL